MLFGRPEQQRSDVMLKRRKIPCRGNRINDNGRNVRPTETSTLCPICHPRVMVSFFVSDYTQAAVRVAERLPDDNDTARQVWPYRLRVQLERQDVGVRLSCRHRQTIQGRAKSSSSSSILDSVVLFRVQLYVVSCAIDAIRTRRPQFTCENGRLFVWTFPSDEKHVYRKRYLSNLSFVSDHVDLMRFVFLGRNNDFVLKSSIVFENKSHYYRVDSKNIRTNRERSSTSISTIMCPNRFKNVCKHLLLFSSKYATRACNV